jgi:hypothetical protein
MAMTAVVAVAFKGVGGNFGGRDGGFAPRERRGGVVRAASEERRQVTPQDQRFNAPGQYGPAKANNGAALRQYTM